VVLPRLGEAAGTALKVGPAKSRNQIGSKTPALRFFATLFQLKRRPFMATYTPGGSTWATPQAKPKLKKASELAIS
ncbi:hypothetical protein ABTE23_21690, partial [Acinetobacter baumannii]